MAYTILIADDEVMLTDLLSAHLRDSGYLTYVAGNSREVMEKLSLRPDLILLDINMPGMDGLELCRAIRGHVSCPILFLTARVGERDKISGLQYGGDDYITKPFSLQELTARIAAHLRRDERGKSRDSVLASGDGLIFNLSQRQVFYGEKEIPLSRREFDLAAFLMAHRGQVFDRERIYEAVWGCDAEGDSQVIKEHVRKIRAKLREAAGKDYIETIWGMGYRWEK